uniref:Uncharacterized protein n=1 Tax=Rhizophora mucronata TaxID=61149 RepID=A0A2P2N8Y2_RHIMU
MEAWIISTKHSSSSRVIPEATFRLCQCRFIVAKREPNKVLCS